MTADDLRRPSLLSDYLDALIAGAITIGRTGDGDRTYVERCRLNVLALAVPEADWLVRIVPGAPA